MHHVRLSDLSIKTLKNMKKRIQFCRDNKDNSITDTFRGLDLNFFENCVDAVIELKEQPQGVDDNSYKDIIDKAIIKDNVDNTSSSDILKYSKSECILNRRYALSTKICEFKSNIKYLYALIDNINDYTELLVIDVLGRVYMCESHSTCDLGSIENDIVIGRFLGTTTLPNLSKDIVETKKNDIPTEIGLSYILFTFDDNLNVKTCLSKQNILYDIRPVSEIDFNEFLKFEDSIINILITPKC